MRPLPLVTALTIVVVGLTACSSDSSDSSKSSSTTTKAGVPATAPVALPGTVNNEGSATIDEDGSTTTIDVDAADFSFSPTFIEAAPSQKITVKLENTGSVTHTFTLAALDIDEELAPGAKAEVAVVAPASGNATFFCRFHQGAGMQGAFYIPS